MAVKKLTNAQLAFLGHFADEWRSMIEIDPTAFDKHGFLKMRVITHIDFLRAWKLIECKVVDNMAPRRYRLTDAGREALDAANAERAESTATIKAAYDARKADAGRAALGVAPDDLRQYRRNEKE